MALSRPLYMQPTGGDPTITYTAQDDRAGLLSAVFSREGVLDVDAGQLKVSQRGAGANMSVDIAVGRCVIFGDDVSDQGAYVCANTTVLNVSTFSTGGAITAPGSGSRTHRVVARVRDKLHNGSWTTYDWLVQVLQDTGSGTPATPASAISLGTITISAGNSSITNAMITDTRTRASVGTADRAGTLSFISAYTPDPLRPPSWRVNPDGWVSLAGWVRWTGTTQAMAGGATSDPMLSVAAAADIRPNTYRDMCIATSEIPVQLTMNSSGQLTFRPWFNVTLTNNVTWFSLDGCGYRL